MAALAVGTLAMAYAACLPCALLASLALCFLWLAALHVMRRHAAAAALHVQCRDSCQLAAGPGWLN